MTHEGGVTKEGWSNKKNLALIAKKASYIFLQSLNNFDALPGISPFQDFSSAFSHVGAQRNFYFSFFQVVLSEELRLEFAGFIFCKNPVETPKLGVSTDANKNLKIANQKNLQN